MGHFKLWVMYFFQSNSTTGLGCVSIFHYHFSHTYLNYIAISLKIKKYLIQHKKLLIK